MSHDARGFLMVLGLAAMAAHAETPPTFAVGYALNTPPGAKAYVVSMPQDAYAWAARDAGLQDVLVVDGKGRQVAAGIYHAAEPTSHPLTMDAPLLAVPPSANGAVGPRIQRSTNGDILIEPGAAATGGKATDWLIDARQPLRPERIEFAPLGRDASFRVDIDASTNLQDWTPVVRDASIVALGSGDGAVDARVVKLAGAAARYYRVRVTSGDTPWVDGAATRVTLSGTVPDASAKDEAPRRWLELAPSDTATSGQGVDYDYRLPDAVPVGALRVKLGKGDNVARFDAIAVQPTMGGEQLGTLVVTPGQHDDAHPLELTPIRRELLRLHSATPLREPPTLLVGWRPDRLVFLPEGTGPYRLLVGSRGTRRPVWPIDDALAALRKDGGPGWRPAEASTGAVEVLAGRKAVDPADAPFDWTRPLLWIVLLLGAAVVVGMATSLLRKPKGGD
ncbi:Protein of unknown function [Luteibacter sp. UNCMF331Sha3.1]|uniref:DUF3999 family protein n=1 Tax=Luteibacter sp. UNCMF331Sha3.1 TaxID=1502760 RepID=UPI0008BB70C6|nr:DUF3999 family protein [Luteibacter sp. UNCMF331Sha3.1]SEN09413.1 Protein of unknown function [Luteibacter sp. UNCMF331Sha3.1]